jgi:hypothetical protein
MFVASENPLYFIQYYSNMTLFVVLPLQLTNPEQGNLEGLLAASVMLVGEGETIHFLSLSL